MWAGPRARRRDWVADLLLHSVVPVCGEIIEVLIGAPKFGPGGHRERRSQWVIVHGSRTWSGIPVAGNPRSIAPLLPCRSARPPLASRCWAGSLRPGLPSTARVSLAMIGLVLSAITRAWRSGSCLISSGRRVRMSSPEAERPRLVQVAK